MLAAKERLSKAVMCSVVPSKSTGEFIAKRVVAFMREFGCEMNVITIKSDNEPALVALVDEVVRVRAARGACKTNVEHSPVKSSKSNGVIERGVQTVQGMMRTMRSALEDRWQTKLEVEHAIWCWLAEYAGWLVNRGEVGHDAIRKEKREAGQDSRNGIWRRGFVETKTGRRTAREAVVYVERRSVPRSERLDGGICDRRRQGDLKNKNGEEEDGRRKMESRKYQVSEWGAVESECGRPARRRRRHEDECD